jgi:sarcosine oxidase
MPLFVMMFVMHYDQIVIGLGAMGSATVYQLAKRGQKVLGIDQFDPPHSLGSSHGDSRIIRQAIAESPEYTPLVLRSYELWKEIEQEAAVELLETTGIIIMVSNTDKMQNKFLTNTKIAAELYSIPHESLNARQIHDRFPYFNLHGNEQGYYEAGAGFLRPEQCVEAQLKLAEKNGAQLRKNEKLLSYKELGDKVVVKTDRGEYSSERLILTAGSWIGELLPQKYKDNFKVYRQVLYWFEIKGDASQFQVGKFPVFNWEFNNAMEDYLYGFPVMDGSSAMKVATEQYEDTTDPNNMNREVGEEEVKKMYETYVKNNLPFLSSKCVQAKACLYTITPDMKFLIDHHPEMEKVIFASPCSGHGFKHSAAIGEMLADMSTGQKTKVDISNFAMSRLES